MRILGIAIALILAGCGGDGSDMSVTKTCTQVGCGPAFSLRWSALPLDEAQIHAASVTVCRNGECYSQSFASTPLPTQVGAGWSTGFPDPSQRDTTHTPLINATWWLESTGYRFDLSYITWATADAQDGDVYDVTLTAGDGSTIVEAHKTVTYVVSYPNGPGCGECRGYNESL